MLLKRFASCSKEVKTKVMYNPSLFTTCGHTHLWQLLGDVTSYEHCFKVHPQVLNYHPSLKDLCGVGQLVDPRLNVFFERSIIPEVCTISITEVKYTCT